MPTANRRVFVPQAIRYFQRQDYPNRELIILDDGSQELADLVPSDSQVRYVRMEQKSTMGAKHNLACEIARGEIIAHWDDDDWMADWRLSYQVEALIAHPTNTLCGLRRLYFFDPAAERAWEYIYPGDDRPWVLGSTFCYRREFSREHRFPDMNEGADTVFVWGLRDAEILAHTRHDFYVGLVHPANTSPKRTQDPAWHAIPVETIYGLLAADRSFYQRLTGADPAILR
jgi:glycosyltransferase involved in cell wall biosynthesis